MKPSPPIATITSRQPVQAGIGKNHLPIATITFSGKTCQQSQAGTGEINYQLCSRHFIGQYGHAPIATINSGNLATHLKLIMAKKSFTNCRPSHASICKNQLHVPPILSSPCAESARAVTGRRCPHSGRGEDFLSRQPDFFTETAVTSERKVEKSFPRWEINRHAEG